MGNEERRGGLPDLPDLGQRMERLWRSLLRHPVMGMSSEGLWHPPVDILDRDDEIVVVIELPGMQGRDIDLSLEEDHLILKGSRPPVSEAEGELYYCERPMGDFHRVIHLPCAVEEGSPEAHYDDGLLTVHLSKTVQERGRRIEIT